MGANANISDLGARSRENLLRDAVMREWKDRFVNWRVDRDEAEATMNFDENEN